MPIDTDTDTDITVIPVEDHTALYHRYPGQTSAQGCHVELDCETRTLSASYDTEIGNALPSAVWHGRVRWYGLPTLRADAANVLLDRLVPLAVRVCDGYEKVWDGHNWTGTLDADAHEAEETIADLCDEASRCGDEIVVWDAADWLDRSLHTPEGFGLRADMTDDEVSALAERLQGEAQAEDVDYVEGLDAHLREWRDDLAAEEDEEDEEDEEEVCSSGHPMTFRDDGTAYCVSCGETWGAPDGEG